MLNRNEMNGLPSVFQDSPATPVPGESRSTSLADLVEYSSADEKRRTVSLNYNCGNPTFGLAVTSREFYEISRIANDATSPDGVAQRALNQTHAKSLGRFLFKGLVNAAIRDAETRGNKVEPALEEIRTLVGTQPYIGIQPIVCNVRGIKPGIEAFSGGRLTDPASGETAGFRVAFLPQHILYVIDGQHRREGYRYVFDFIQSTLSSGKIGKQGNLIPSDNVVGDISPEWRRAFEAIDRVTLSMSTVQIECHLGLSIDEERQLFSDLNSLGLNVNKNLTLRFDGSNPINEYVKSRLIDQNDPVSWPIIEDEKVSDIKIADGAMLRRELVAINAQLFVNSGSIKAATPQKVEGKREIADRFWSQVAKIDGIGVPGSSEVSVISQSIVLKAMAKLCYALSPKKEGDDEGDLEKYLDSIPVLDLSHENPAWRYYNASDRSAPEFEGLAEYLPLSESKTLQRGIGVYDFEQRRVTFATRVNDVIPLLGDMIRWELGLPNRHEKKKAAAAAA